LQFNVTFIVSCIFALIYIMSGRNRRQAVQLLQGKQGPHEQLEDPHATTAGKTTIAIATTTTTAGAQRSTNNELELGQLPGRTDNTNVHVSPTTPLLMANASETSNKATVERTQTAGMTVQDVEEENKFKTAV
jgi:hypothetical protein